MGKDFKSKFGRELYTPLPEPIKEEPADTKKAKKNATWYVEIDLIDKINRIAYWDRLDTTNDVLAKLIKFYLKHHPDKGYPPIPEKEEE